MGRIKVNFNGEQVETFDSSFGHTFTDEELAALGEGQTIAFDAVSKTGNNYSAIGRFESDVPGRVKFVMDFDAPVVDACFTNPPETFLGVRFTEDERRRLLEGERSEKQGFHSKRTDRDFDAAVYWGESDKTAGLKQMCFDFDN